MQEWGWLDVSEELRVGKTEFIDGSAKAGQAAEEIVEGGVYLIHICEPSRTY